MKDEEISFVHESSYVDDGVFIGKDTKIWHFCHIMEGTVIGDLCNIGQNCVIGPNVIIGKGCRIQNNVHLFEGVELEDYVFIGPSAVFTNVRSPNPYGNSKLEKILVKKGAMIGANSTIISPCTIGVEAFIGAGSVVTKDVPDGIKVVGNPAKLYRGSF